MSDTTPVKKQSVADNAALLPPVDVIEDASGITLYADLPGVPKDRLHLQIEADTLTIEGEIDLEMPGGMEASHAEVGLPRYRRVFTLSKELDASKVTASSARAYSNCRSRKPSTRSRARSRSGSPDDLITGPAGGVCLEAGAARRLTAGWTATAGHRATASGAAADK